MGMVGTKGGGGLTDWLLPGRLQPRGEGAVLPQGLPDRAPDEERGAGQVRAGEDPVLFPLHPVHQRGGGGGGQGQGGCQQLDQQDGLDQLGEGKMIGR